MINKFTKALLATTLFVLVLLTVYAVHMNMFRVNVVFYAAIADALILNDGIDLPTLREKAREVWTHWGLPDPGPTDPVEQ